MTKKTVALALAVAALLATGCTRSSGAGGATPEQISAASPTMQDVRTLLGSNSWWIGPPSFGVRPLGLPNMPENVRFTITQHFVHVGAAGELFIIEYAVWANTSFASTQMTNLQNSLGTVPGPRAGDQALYYGFRPMSNTSVYETFAIVRVGQVIISAVLTLASGFADLNEMGRIANKLVSRLKDAVNRRVRPSTLSAADAAVLPPAGYDITLVGAVRLPVEAAAVFLTAVAPDEFVSGLHNVGVRDFTYADYALDADLTMEVRAAVFSFSSADEAAAWTDQYFGRNNLDQNGVAVGYDSAAGEYIAFELVGSHVGLAFCNALDQLSAASRACETPFARVVAGWHISLSGGTSAPIAPSPSPQATPSGA